MISHVVPHFGPNGKEGTLALVVASVIFVGGTKVPRHDGTVHGSHNFAKG
jgi:hypothetical protein